MINFMRVKDHIINMESVASIRPYRGGLAIFFKNCEGGELFIPEASLVDFVPIFQRHGI